MKEFSYVITDEIGIHMKTGRNARERSEGIFF